MARFLRTKYLQYKRDTQSLSTWLAQAAIQHGYPRSNFAKQKLGAQDNKAVYVLKTHQYTEIALFLVKRNADVPLEVLSLIRRCIALRNRSLRRFLAKPDAATRTHEHFINVLVEVSSILERASPGPSTQNKDASVLGNRFAALADLSLTDDVEDMPDIEIPPGQSDSSALAADELFDLEDTPEAALMALLVFISDLHDVRDYIRALWADYRDGKADLLTCAVTSNTALELLRRPHTEIIARVLPHFNDDLNMAMFALCTLLLQLQGTRMVHPPLPLYNDMTAAPEALIDIYEYLFIPCHQILDGLSRVIVDRLVPLYDPGFYGTYNQPSKTDSFSTRCQQMQILALESFADYLTLMCTFDSVVKSPHARTASERDASGNPYLIDEMAIEMDTLARTRRSSLLLALMLQIFVDLNFDLGAATRRAWEELRAGSARMLLSLAKRDKVESKVKPPTWPAQAEELIGMFKEEARYWTSKEDPVTIVRKTLARKLPGNDPSKYGSTLMVRSPILAGILLFRLQLQYQMLGFDLVNIFGTVLSSGHLLVACRHSGTLPSMSKRPLLWPDMEKVFSMHGEAEIFDGRVPTTVSESNVAFLRMTGHSTDILKKASRAGVPASANLRTEPGHGPKGLADRTQVLPIFQKKYLRGSPTPIDISDVEKLLSDMLARQKREATVKQRKGNRVDRKLLRKERSRKNSDFTVPQLLSVLEAGLRLETESIRFDYVSMHVTCLQLLESVRSVTHDYLVGKLGPAYLDAEYQLPWIVGYILAMATTSGMAAKQLGFVRPGSFALSKLLTSAADAMRKFLADPKVASAEITKLRLGKATE